MEGILQCNEALTELLTDWDNDAAGPFPFEEEMIEEVMQEFYKEIIACPANKPPSPTPLPSLSLSETETGPVVVEPVELPGGDGSDEFGEVNEMELAAEGDFDDDDEWLATMLSWGQLVDSTDQLF